jgi:hypothetical protein
MNLLANIRAYQRALLDTRRKSALADLHPELRETRACVFGPG